MKKKIQDYEKSKKQKSYNKDLAQESRISGTVVIFDIVNSTKLKIAKQFPN